MFGHILADSEMQILMLLCKYFYDLMSSAYKAYISLVHKSDKVCWAEFMDATINYHLKTRYDGLYCCIMTNSRDNFYSKWDLQRVLFLWLIFPMSWTVVIYYQRWIVVMNWSIGSFDLILDGYAVTDGDIKDIYMIMQFAYQILYFLVYCVYFMNFFFLIWKFLWTS